MAAAVSTAAAESEEPKDSSARADFRLLDLVERMPAIDASSTVLSAVPTAISVANGTPVALIISLAAYGTPVTRRMCTSTAASATPLLEPLPEALPEALPDPLPTTRHASVSHVLAHAARICLPHLLSAQRALSCAHDSGLPWAVVRPVLGLSTQPPSARHASGRTSRYHVEGACVSEDFATFVGHGWLVHGRSGTAGFGVAQAELGARSRSLPLTVLRPFAMTQCTARLDFPDPQDAEQAPHGSRDHV